MPKSSEFAGLLELLERGVGARRRRPRGACRGAARGSGPSSAARARRSRRGARGGCTRPSGSPFAGCSGTVPSSDAAGTPVVRRRHRRAGSPPMRRSGEGPDRTMAQYQRRIDRVLEPRVSSTVSTARVRSTRCAAMHEECRRSRPSSRTCGASPRPASTSCRPRSTAGPPAARSATSSPRSPRSSPTTGRAPLRRRPACPATSPPTSTRTSARPRASSSSDGTLANLPDALRRRAATHASSELRALEREVSEPAPGAARRASTARARPDRAPHGRAGLTSAPGGRRPTRSKRRLHDLGEFIRDQRRNARLSLRKLSELAGISNPYLSQIERGLRKPSAEILQAIARACASRPRRSTCGPGSSTSATTDPDLVAGDPRATRRSPSARSRC